jgi:outer membrane protein insertion porin family
MNILFYLIAFSVLSYNSLFTANKALQKQISKRQHVVPQEKKKEQAFLPTVFIHEPIIDEIVIKGLKNIPIQAIYGKIPFKEGDKLDPLKARNILKNIFSMGYFSDVKVLYEYTTLDKKHIILFIEVEEKYKLSHIKVNGNSHLSKEILEKKLGISKIKWIDHRDVHILIKKIKKLYVEKQYNRVDISYFFVTEENGVVGLELNVNEGIPSYIRKITFSGNKCLSHHQLKQFIASKEYWILGFFDRGGIFRREMIDYDKYLLENFYQSKGFFEAYVKSVDVVEHEDGSVDLEYFIYEGESHTINSIETEYVTTIDGLDPYAVKRLILVKRGDLYSKDLLRESIAGIKDLLGSFGYMQSNVYPKTKMNKKDKTLDITFVIDPGKPIYIHNIVIKGNTKTYENVIRRELWFNPGDMLTSRKLDESKRNLENLGYFMPMTGIIWNMIPFDTYQTDLNLIIQEGKTGRFYFKASVSGGSDAGKSLQNNVVGGGPRWYDTLLSSSNIGFTVQNSNWLGRGIRYYLDTTLSQVDRSLNIGMSTNWLLDWPLSAGWNASVRKIKYEDFKQSINTPEENNIGANLQFGFRSHFWNMKLIGLAVGFDNISYDSPIMPKLQFPDNPTYQAAFNEIIIRSFQPGTLTWTTVSVSDDKRNNPIRPTEGYQWVWDTKIAIPNTITSDQFQFGFLKIGFDARWYTPLIKQYNVVLHLHGYAGLVHQMPGKLIPYKELFHVGGPQSVRGFLFGQIGPSVLGSSLGGRKSFFVNAEIQCPINRDGSIAGVLFYDGGAAWDTIFKDSFYVPSTNQTVSALNLIKNNNFKYRHSVGVGVRMTVPAPIKVDWGFKLDRNRKIGESLYEVHISMEGSY